MASSLLSAPCAADLSADLLADDDGLDSAFIRCSKLKKEPLQWLWPGRVPLGKLTLLVRRPRPR